MKETEYTEYTLREFELTSIDDVSYTSFIQNMALHTINIYYSLVIIIHYVPGMLELCTVNAWISTWDTEYKYFSKFRVGWVVGAYFIFQLLALKVLDF